VPGDKRKILEEEFKAWKKLKTTHEYVLEEHVLEQVDFVLYEENESGEEGEEKDEDEDEEIGGVAVLADTLAEPFKMLVARMYDLQVRALAWNGLSLSLRFVCPSYQSTFIHSRIPLYKNKWIPTSISCAGH
jgi:hypothetical protein